MAKIISYAKEKAKVEGKKEKPIKKIEGKKEEIAEKETGILVWLHCPRCKIFQYSEVVAPYGRKHQCGEQVKEIEITLDITAEYTICRHNLQHIENLKNSLLHYSKKTKKIEITEEEKKIFLSVMKDFQANEIQMIEKLQAITKKKKLEAYEWKKENKKLLPVIKVHNSGILISEFRYRPEKRFQDYQNQ